MVLENPTGFCAAEFDNVEDGGGGAEGFIVPDPIFGYICIFFLVSFILYSMSIIVRVQYLYMFPSACVVFFSLLLESI